MKRNPLCAQCVSMRFIPKSVVYIFPIFVLYYNYYYWNIFPNMTIFYQSIIIFTLYIPKTLFWNKETYFIPRESLFYLFRNWQLHTFHVISKLYVMNTGVVRDPTLGTLHVMLSSLPPLLGELRLNWKPRPSLEVLSKARVLVQYIYAYNNSKNIYYIICSLVTTGVQVRFFVSKSCSSPTWIWYEELMSGWPSGLRRQTQGITLPANAG